MLLESRWINRCDLADHDIKSGEGLALLGRGASGRVAAVLYVCQACAQEHGWEVSTRQAAEQWARSVPGGWLDFET